MEKSLFKNSIFKSLLNICNILIPVLVGPYVLRILDRKYYDLYNSLNTVFQFFMIFGALGIYNYGVREISKIRGDKEKSSRFFTEMFIIGLVSNCVVAGLYIGYMLLSSANDLSKILCLVLAVQFISNTFNLEWINEANENYGFIALKSIIVKLLYFVCIILFIRQSDDIVIYVLLLSLSIVLNTLVSFIYIKRKCSFVFSNLNFKRHIMPILTTFVIANVMLFYAQFDKLMLSMFVNESNVTSYQIAQYISSLSYTVLVAIVTVTIPRVSNMIANGKMQEGRAIHQSASSMFMMLMIPLTVGIILLAENIVIIYGGEQYVDCINPLKVYAVLQLVSSLHYIVGEGYIYVTGKEKVLLLINIIGAGINVLLNFVFILIGVFDSVVASIALTLAYLIIGIIDIIIVRKQCGYKYNPIEKNTVLYFCASLVFVPIVFLFKLLNIGIILEAIVCVVACMVAYLGILLIFKDEKMLSILNFIKKKMSKTKG